MSRQTLRQTFGEDAELYDRVRPTYPPRLFDDLAGMLGDEPRVLEIGPGTGQATAAMVARGWSVTAVELSLDLAGVLRRKVPQVEVVVADFDTWELPVASYDLVISATAFHWLDPETRMRRCADVLRPGGALAVVETYHVAGGTQQFFRDVQRCYERFTDDADKDGGEPQPADAVPRDSSEFDASGRYGPVEFRRYPWDRAYSAAEYLELLSSYSGHRALTSERRDGLYECVRALIDAAGGSVTKSYLNQLCVGISLDQGLA